MVFSKVLLYNKKLNRKLIVFYAGFNQKNNSFTWKFLRWSDWKSCVLKCEFFSNSEFIENLCFLGRNSDVYNYLVYYWSHYLNWYKVQKDWLIALKQRVYSGKIFRLQAVKNFFPDFIALFPTRINWKKKLNISS